MKSAAVLVLVCYALLVPVCFTDISARSMSMTGMEHTSIPHVDFEHHVATYHAATEGSPLSFFIFVVAGGVALLLLALQWHYVRLQPQKIPLSRAHTKRRAWLTRKKAGPPSVA